jgi:hypothetical protein
MSRGVMTEYNASSSYSGNGMNNTYRHNFVIEASSSGREVISLQKVNSLLVFGYNGGAKKVSAT